MEDFLNLCTILNYLFSPKILCPTILRELLVHATVKSNMYVNLFKTTAAQGIVCAVNYSIKLKRT